MMEAAGSSKTFVTSQTTIQKTIILIQSRGWKYLELLYYFLTPLLNMQFNFVAERSF